MPLSPGFGRGTEDCALARDARSTRRASHSTFLARDGQKQRPGPPAVCHRVLPTGRQDRVGAAPDQPERFRQKRPNAGTISRACYF